MKSKAHTPKPLAPNFQKLLKIANRLTEEHIANGHPTHSENNLQHRRRVHTMRFFAKNKMIDVTPQVLKDHRTLSRIYSKSEQENRFVEPQEIVKEGIDSERLKRVKMAVFQQMQPVIREFHTAYLREKGSPYFKKNTNCLRALRKSHDAFGGYLDMYLDELQDYEEKQRVLKNKKNNTTAD